MKKIRPNIIDRAVGYFSPSRAVNRMRSRAVLDVITAGAVERSSGSRKGSLGNWLPTKISKWQDARQREIITSRAEHLVANDAHAASVVDSLSINVVGVGLKPQSKPYAKVLGIKDEQALEIAEQAEWAWQIWNREADCAGRTTFAGVQFQAIYSMLVSGEILCLPVMLKDTSRTLSLAAQLLDPQRLQSPSDKMNEASLFDGVSVNHYGQPTGYYIYDPTDRNAPYKPFKSGQFKYFPARRGHRPVVLHNFFAKQPETVRGVSILSPAMKAFKDLGDYMDFELIGAIVAASFPVFIELNTTSPVDFKNGIQTTATEDGRNSNYQEVEPGQIYYGASGEHPQVLESKRPSGTFNVFVETILRSIGASAGIPYEVVSKDFSKTNYSSARAALLEAWRVYTMYRFWLVDHFCQPFWEMFFEESWLRGLIELPAGAPDFYDARAAYCRTDWIGPAKGHVDPVKEMNANILGINNHITTLADVVAEQGRDWESQMEQRAREKQKMESLGITAAAPSPQTIQDDNDEKPDRPADQ